MIIKSIAIGNNDEAFIEGRLKQGLNIISSDDNNKGKTIVLQSMMYALGNEPIFPSSFNYKNYNHIVEVITDSGIAISICRKRTSFVVIHSNNILVFDNLSEFKFFLKRQVFDIPYIIKDGYRKLVDPVLFYQLFFVGQDNKDTSNIFQKGYYNKDDYINMLYSYCGIDNVEIDRIDVDKLKSDRKRLLDEKRELQQKNKILKSNLSAVQLVSMSNDRAVLSDKLDKIEKIKKIIIDLSKKRNNSINRKTKNEITLKELRSLNRTLVVGQLHCMECDSKNIGYSTEDKAYTFDVSNTEIRNQILSSIEERIEIYSEEISEYTIGINRAQEEMKALLDVPEVSIESLLMYKTDLIDSNDADVRITEIDNELSNIQIMIKDGINKNENDNEKRKEIHNYVIDEMNGFYKKLDPSGNIVFDKLFSKKQSVYSGCEKTEFYLSKLYAIKSVTKHNNPIIMDSFRDGELSTKKEDMVLSLFCKLDNQIIFTATLKDEEQGKYKNIGWINNIDYAVNQPCKILSEENVDRFLKIYNKFSIV